MTSLKILWVPQLSTTINGKFNLTSDSNWRYFSDMVIGLKKVDSNIQIHAVVPSEEQLVDIKQLDEADPDKFISIKMYVHAFAQRFDFNYEKWIQIVRDFDYNVVFVNDPTLVMNIKSLYAVLNKKPPFIVSYNHWPDNPLSPKTPDFMSYFFRQIEGAVYSDLHLVNTNFSKKFLIDGAKKVFNEDIIKSLNKKIVAAYCPIVEVPFATIGLKIKKIKHIAYTQRLSDLPYYRKALDNCITILSDVYKQDQNFVLRLFNPANKIIPQEYVELPFVEVVYPKTKEEYYKLLAECYLSLDCYDDERVWSISQNEATNLMVMPILRYVDGYKEMYDKNYGGFYTTNSECVKKILYALKNELWVNRQTRKARKFMLDMFNEKAVANLVYHKIVDNIGKNTNNSLNKIIKVGYEVLK